MEEKKSLKRSLSTILLLFAIIVIIAMAYYIYIEKTNDNKEIANLELNVDNMKNTIDESQEESDSKSNTINSDGNNTSNQNKSVQYEFTSADQAATKGYPKILKIFKLTENELEFEYNSAFDFSKSTLDRQLSGIARTNAEQIYEFEETVDGHQYKLRFEFNKSKDTVKVYEYDNGNEIGFINLFR